MDIQAAYDEGYAKAMLLKETLSESVSPHIVNPYDMTPGNRELYEAFGRGFRQAVSNSQGPTYLAG